MRENHSLMWVYENFNGEPEEDIFKRPICGEFIGDFFTDSNTVEMIIDLLMKKENRKASYLCDTVYSNLLQQNIHNYYHVIG